MAPMLVRSLSVDSLDQEQTDKKLRHKKTLLQAGTEWAQQIGQNGKRLNTVNSNYRDSVTRKRSPKVLIAVDTTGNGQNKSDKMTTMSKV